MVAPINRPPVAPSAPPVPKVSRAAVANDIAFAAVVAARTLLAHDDPKVVLAAAKTVFEFEKIRLRAVDKLGHDPLAEQFDAAPQVSDQASEPKPAAVAAAEVEPETRPQPRPARPMPIRDRGPVCPPAGDTARLRGVKPSISSFLPPKVTGSNTACPLPSPQPPPTPHSSPTPPS